MKIEELLKNLDQKMYNVGIISEDEYNKFKEETENSSMSEITLLKKDEHQTKLVKEYQNKINKKYLNIDNDKFEKLCKKLPETFLINILTASKNYIRFEYRNKDVYFFLTFNSSLLRIKETDLNNGYVYNATFDMSEKVYNLFMNKIYKTINKWDINYLNDDEVYFGLSFYDDNTKESKLYVGNSNYPHNWEKFIKIINKIKQTFIKKLL